MPQEGPADASAAVFVTPDPFAPSLLHPYNGHPLQRTAIVEVEGYLVNARDLPVGAPVCEVMLWGSGGPPQVWVFRAGKDLLDCKLTPGEEGPRCTVYRTRPLHFDRPGAMAWGVPTWHDAAWNSPWRAQGVRPAAHSPAACGWRGCAWPGYLVALPLPSQGRAGPCPGLLCAGCGHLPNEGAPTGLWHRAWVAGLEEEARRACGARL